MPDIGALIQIFVYIILMQEIFPSRGRRIDLRAQTIFLSFVLVIQLITLFARLYFYGVWDSVIFLVFTLILGAKVIFNLRELRTARSLTPDRNGRS